MAKYRTAAHSAGVDIADSFYDIALGKHNSHFATYVDDFTGWSFRIKGRDLLFDGTELIRGTITSVTYYDMDGKPLASITDVSASARELHADSPDMSSFDLATYLMAGNDTVLGSAADEHLYGLAGKDRIIGGGGNDHINGITGNDILTGGKGVDVFFFLPNQGRDTITDFDSDGPQDKHDILRAQDATSYEVERDGRDTIVIFDNGSSARLLDFKPSELDALDVDVFQV
jgi:hypothetical protein